jgi:hypothetical protein
VSRFGGIVKHFNILKDIGLSHLSRQDVLKDDQLSLQGCKERLHDRVVVVIP